MTGFVWSMFLTDMRGEAARCGMSLLGSPGDPWWRWSDCPDAGNAGASLSGGQRQKLGSARALLSQAEYMIFDEATSSVDPESEREIWETIGHLVHTRTLLLALTECLQSMTRIVSM